jgi:hypothetical protein
MPVDQHFALRGGAVSKWEIFDLHNQRFDFLETYRGSNYQIVSTGANVSHI